MAPINKRVVHAATSSKVPSVHEQKAIETGCCSYGHMMVSIFQCSLDQDVEAL
jgi:hypothetical protein